jgi:hypothetical protein
MMTMAIEERIRDMESLALVCSLAVAGEEKYSDMCKILELPTDKPELIGFMKGLKASIELARGRERKEEFVHLAW